VDDHKSFVYCNASGGGCESDNQGESEGGTQNKQQSVDHLVGSR